MATKLPSDMVLLHILPYLPAKSALRFNCVSKEWYSFLTTPMFANMHLHHQNHHKLLLFKSITTTRSSCTFRTLDCEAPEDDLTPSRYLPFKVDYPRNVSVITSCNGMVCIGIKCYKDGMMNEYYSDLILWNPFTGEYKTLAKTGSCKECYESKTRARATILYYISSEDDYKLLRVTKARNIYIYSLKFNVWRKIEPTEYIHRLSCWFSNHSASVNEKLYILKEDDEADVYSVIRLDLKTEKFTRVATPLRKNLTSCLGFTVLRGCIHIWMRDDRHIDLWRMDGDEDWMKLATYFGTVDVPIISYQQPLHLMADGNWLLLYLHFLFITCPKKPHKCVSTYTPTRFGYHYIEMDIHPAGKYLETLVSPNQYMR